MVKFVKIILNRNDKIFSNIRYLEDIYKLYGKYSKYLTDDYTESSLDELLNLVEKTCPYFWAIVKKDTEEFAGFVFLENFIGNKNQLHSAEITTCFEKKFWGSFTKYCAKKFIRYCFKKYELKKLKALVFKENSRVKVILKQSGFKKEAELKAETLKNNQLQDIEIFSIIKKEVKDET